MSALACTVSRPRVSGPLVFGESRQRIGLVPKHTSASFSCADRLRRAPMKESGSAMVGKTSRGPIAIVRAFTTVRRISIISSRLSLSQIFSFLLFSSVTVALPWEHAHVQSSTQTYEKQACLLSQITFL